MRFSVPSTLVRIASLGFASAMGTCFIAAVWSTSETPSIASRNRLGSRISPTIEYKAGC